MLRNSTYRMELNADVPVSVSLTEEARQRRLELIRGTAESQKMSFVDSLMDMLKNGGQEDGAATARNNLSQTWDYPSLVAALPYRYYDDTNEIFVNAGSAGFMMEAAPLPGANEQVMAALDDMLRKSCPEKRR